MKKSITISIVVLLLLASSLYASDENVLMTKIEDGTSLYNGRLWLSLDSQSKVCYVMGLEEGATLGGSVICREFNLISENDGLRVQKVSSASFPKGINSEIVDYIDEAYRNPLNRPAPIIDIYLCMAFEQNDKLKKSDRDEYLRKMIAKYQY